jgi:hypothetical protein
MKNDNFIVLLKKYSDEIIKLKILLRKYNISLNPIDMFRLGWRKTLIFIIQQFDTSDYPRLFVEEKDNLKFALSVLKILPLKNYDKNSVRGVFEECNIPLKYYDDILNQVFDKAV